MSDQNKNIFDCIVCNKQFKAKYGLQKHLVSKIHTQMIEQQNRQNQQNQSFDNVSIINTSESQIQSSEDSSEIFHVDIDITDSSELNDYVVNQTKIQTIKPYIYNQIEVIETDYDLQPDIDAVDVYTHDNQIYIVQQNGTQKHCISDLYTVVPQIDVPVNNDTIVQKESQMTKIYYKNYRPSEQQLQCLNHTTYKQRQQKIIHDYRLNFQKDIEYQYCIYDIETFCLDESNSEFPNHLNRGAEIGTIAFLLVNGKNIKKYCYINNTNKYTTNNVNEDISLTKFVNENEMCQAFFRMLKEQTKQTILFGYNASSSVHDTNNGFDMNFILNRSQQSYIPKFKKYQCKYNASMSSAFVKIVQLSNIHFYETQKAVAQYLFSQKNRTELPLKNILKYFKIGSEKDEMDFHTLSTIFRKKGSDISNIIKYNIQDCQVVLDIENKMQFLNLMITQGKILNIPLSMALHNTNTQQFEHQLLNRYRQQQYLVQYIPKDNQCQFKGGYTYFNNKVQFANNVICADYESLYPSIMIALNTSVESIKTQQDFENDQENIYECKFDDVDDTYYFSKKLGVFSTLIQELLEERLISKEKAKQCKIQGDIDGYSVWTNIQLCQKVIINGAFGYAGYPQSLFFSLPVAATICGFGRQLIQKTNKIVEELGMNIVGNDTDSLTFTLIPEYDTSDKVNQLMKEINIKINNQTQCDREFKLTIEEIIPVMYNISKKSYIWGYIPMNENKQFIVNGNEWTYDSKTFSDYKYRGVNFGKLSGIMEKQLQTDISNFFEVQPDPGQYISDLYLREKENILYAMKCKDIEFLKRYSEHVRNGGKAKIVKTILARYPKLATKDFFQILYTVIGKLKSESCIPVEMITENNINTLDAHTMALNYSNCFKKIVKHSLTLEQQQKCQHGGLSPWKKLMAKLQNQREDNEIIVREESIIGSRMKREYYLLDINSIAYTVDKSQNKSYHEVICDNIIRLSFDVDEMQFENEIEDFTDVLINLGQELFGGNFSMSVWNIQNQTTKKISFHVYTNISVEIQYAQFIANEINVRMNKKYVDISIYALHKSLRLYGTPKISKDTLKIDHNSKFERPQFKIRDQHLMTNIDGCIFQPTPIHLSSQYPLNIQYQLKDEDDFAVNEEEAMKNYLNKYCKMTEYTQKKQGNLLNITSMSIWYCPIHDRNHGNENCFFAVKKSGIIFKCRRDMKESRTVEIDGKQEIYSLFDQLQNKLKSNTQVLITQQLLNQKYLEIPAEVMDQRLIFLRSALGTGKTFQVQKLIENHEKVLIISFRKTYTFDIQARFGNCLSYLDTTGNLDFDITIEGVQKQFKIIICQVESLDRIVGNPSLIIMDEIESIQTQLTSKMCCVDRGAIVKIQSLAQYASQVVVCDGFLQNSTIDFIRKLTGIEKYQAIQNNYQPYNGYRANITITNEKVLVLQNIFEKVSKGFERGERTVCFISGNKQSEKLQKMLIERFGDMIKIVRYHGDNMRINEEGVMHQIEKSQDMKNINLITSNVDVLIYTSTMTSGVDIQTDFDNNISWLTKDSCDAFQFVQGIFRCRKLLNKKLNLYITASNDNQMTTPLKECSGIYQTVITKDLPRQCLTHLIARQKCIRSNIQQIVIHQIQELGFTINLLDEVQKVSIDRKVNSQIAKEMKGQEIIDWDEELSEECWKLFVQIKEHNKQIDSETCKKYANQFKMVRQGMGSGFGLSQVQQFREQEFQDQIQKLQDSGLIAKRLDINQAISAYIETYRTQLLAHNRFTKLGLTLQLTMKKVNQDIKDRSHNVNNLFIDVNNINQQILHQDVAGRIPQQLIYEGTIDANCEELKPIREYLTEMKQKNHHDVLIGAYNSLGYIVNLKVNTKRIEKVAKRLVSYNIAKIIKVIS